MAVLADLERTLERLFERSTARLFRARLQPVQIEHRVERSMERARASRGGRTLVPARYRVRLHPADMDDVVDRSEGPEALAGRLADAALAFARGHDYQLPSRPIVFLVADPSLQRGVVEVDAVVTEIAAPAPLVPDMPVVPARGVADGDEAAGVPATGASPVDRPALKFAGDDLLPQHVDAPPEPAVLVAAVGAPVASGVGSGIRGDGTQTLVFRRPAPPPTRAVLRVTGRDGKERVVQVDGTPMTVGRATDNALVLADSRVSRHHARVQARRGTLVLTDLGSTNGSRVNGVRVDECALGTGDRILVGDTVLLVEQLPG